VQLDKLLKLLPTKLNLRSKASSRAKGALAVKVTGEANDLVNNKDAVLAQTSKADAEEKNANRPKALAVAAMETPMSQLNLENTVYGFTKLIWLNKPADTMQSIIANKLAQDLFTDFLKTTSIMYQYQFDFVCKFFEIASAQVHDIVYIITWL
jgi:hypothetical protein